MERTKITINLESNEIDPALPKTIIGHHVAWETERNPEAQRGITWIGTIDSVPLDNAHIEDMAEILYHLARILHQDCVAMKVHKDANLSRTVGPFAFRWYYDDSKVLEPEA